MGMFDWVRCNDSRVRCHQGHALTDLQTKNFNCTLGVIAIENGQVTHTPGVGGCAVYAGVISEAFNFYMSGCDACGDADDEWYEFIAIVKDGRLVSIRDIRESPKAPMPAIGT